MTNKERKELEDWCFTLDVTERPAMGESDVTGLIRKALSSLDAARREGWEACRERAAKVAASYKHLTSAGQRNIHMMISSLPYEEPTGHREQSPLGTEWKLVPVEPTQEMLDAMDDNQFMRGAWKDALAAAPPCGTGDALTLLEAMEQECWSLNCVSIPTGGGDADVGWRVISHHMAKPQERVEAVGNTPLAALRAALTHPKATQGEKE